MPFGKRIETSRSSPAEIAAGSTLLMNAIVLSQRSLSSAKLASSSAIAGASIPASRAMQFFALSDAIWNWAGSGRMSSASRASSSAASSPSAAALSSQARMLVRLATKTGAEAS